MQPRTEESPDIQLLDLVRETKEVVGWMQLGLQLGVPKHTLEVIRCQYAATYGEEMCKTEMLSTWLNIHEEKPTWAEVVLAVSRTGNKKLARKIADKYGFALATLNESSTRDIKDSPVAMAVNDILEPLRRELEETRKAVEDNDGEMQLCARKKRKLEGDIAETRDNGDIVQKYTEMLIHDKRSLEQKLEEREKDLRSLQTQQLQYERTIRDLDVKLATAGTKAKQKLKERLKLVKQEKEELVSRIEAQQKEKSKLLKRIDKLTLKLDRAKKDLLTVQSQLELKTSQLDEVHQQFQFIQDQRDDLRRQLEVRERVIEESIMQHVDRESVSNKELQFQSWRSCRDMPFAMSGAQTVLLDGQVYIGSGYTYKDEFQYDILVYTPDKDEWSQLPPCPVKQFAMTLVNHQLVLVGGRENSMSHSTITDKLSVWDGTAHQWTHPYPPMPTALDGVCAVGYQHYLVAAGGSQILHLHQKSVLDNVEVLDTMSSQWHTAQPLPIRCDLMRPAVVGNTLYLLDSSSSQFSFLITKMLAVSLPALISHATSHTLTAPTWESLPNMPLTGSTALALQNSRLLALGGENERHECCSSVYLYNPVSKEWVKVGDMPFGKSSLGCAVLPSGELLVFGGHDEQFRHSKQVYKVMII